MSTLTFQTLSFAEKGEHLEITLLRNFSVCIPKKEVESLGRFTLPNRQSISFPRFQDGEKLKTKFSFLLNKHFKNLKNKLTGNKVTYIHQNSGIPLIGSIAFGIIYRNSSVIEIKPVTSCNLNCIYCSIGEGLHSKKNDFVVEKDYLVEELGKLIQFAGGKVEVHIGVQGEPFLYADIDNLIADLQAMEEVQTISIDTNGTLLSREKIDQLARFAKLQINFSLDALDEELAKRLAGVKSYDVRQVKKMIAYAVEKMPRLPVIAPVLIEGYNEKEMEKIILWSKTLKRPPVLGIQNFLEYKTGRRPARAAPWSRFYSLLAEWEKKYQLRLRLDRDFFNIRKARELPKPFRKREIVSAVIKCPDRFPGSVIAVSRERNISVPDCRLEEDKKIRIRITKDKHNLFAGEVV